MPNLALLALEPSDGTVVLTSIVLVFAMLIALCLIIMAEGKIFDSMKSKADKPKPPKAEKSAPRHLPSRPRNPLPLPRRRRAAFPAR